jgi:hypothetical protein
VNLESSNYLADGVEIASPHIHPALTASQSVGMRTSWVAYAPANPLTTAPSAESGCCIIVGLFNTRTTDSARAHILNVVQELK